MNKKPGLFFSVCALAMIVLASLFKWNLFNSSESVTRTKDVAKYIFVCPTASDRWDSISSTLVNGKEFMYMGLIFMIIVLLFAWGWALYQNLLKDKFNADVYKNPWGITKIVFWAVIIAVLLVKTPNYFRRVDVRGHGNNWVLCENTSEGAKAAPYKMVSAE